MKVSVLLDFTDAHRALVARFLGRAGLATHLECKAWAKHQVIGSLAVMAQAPPLPRPPTPLPSLDPLQTRTGDR